MNPFPQVKTRREKKQKIHFSSKNQPTYQTHTTAPGPLIMPQPKTTHRTPKRHTIRPLPRRRRLIIQSTILILILPLFNKPSRRSAPLRHLQVSIACLKKLYRQKTRLDKQTPQNNHEKGNKGSEKQLTSSCSSAANGRLNL